MQILKKLTYGKLQILCRNRDIIRQRTNIASSGSIKKFGNRVLLTYGGGSIKKTGLYDKVMQLLADFKVFELNGIQPNPRIESVYEGIKICRDNNIDVILAVGGGSTIDCSKAIASGYYYEGDAWEMIMNPQTIKKHCQYVPYSPWQPPEARWIQQP